MSDEPVPPDPRGAAQAANSDVEEDELGTVPTLDRMRPQSEQLPPPPPGPRPDALVGTVVENRYRVEAVLGEGGMGVVYRCRHKIIDKKIAMKVLRADLARDREVTERFLMEARSASAIGDEHIIDISDFGVLPDGATYFVMEFLDGQPLTKVIRGNPVPLPRILHIALQLGQGLAAAHEAGIVHRDLKPDNIFLITRGKDSDFVKILDFGIAKVSTSGGGGQLTRAGSVFGTPHYMAPEQAAGMPVDHRGDIYSFGVILYELACGKVPFDADNFMGILTQHMYKAPVPIRALVPPPADVPPGLEAIVLKCLSKRPEHRYSNVKELCADLSRVRDGLVPDAVGEMMARSGGFNVPNDFFKGPSRMPAPFPATPERRRSSWPLVAGAAGVSVAVALVVAIFAHSSSSPASNASATAGSTTPPASPSTPPGVPQRLGDSQRADSRTGAAPVAASVRASTTTVAIAAEPVDAEIFRGEKSLGTSPVMVEVVADEHVELEVRHAGYVPQHIVLDTSAPKRLVRLERVRAGTAGVRLHAAPPNPTHAPTPAIATPPRPAAPSGGEIVNPWGR